MLIFHIDNRTFYKNLKKTTFIYSAKKFAPTTSIRTNTPIKSKSTIRYITYPSPELALETVELAMMGASSSHYSMSDR